MADLGCGSEVGCWCIPLVSHKSFYLSLYLYDLASSSHFVKKNGMHQTPRAPGVGRRDQSIAMKIEALEIKIRDSGKATYSRHANQHCLLQPKNLSANQRLIVAPFPEKRRPGPQSDFAFITPLGHSSGVASRIVSSIAMVVV